MPIGVIRRFLDAVKERLDYPNEPQYDDAMDEATTLALALKVLKARKGDAHGYAAFLVGQCDNADELPKTVREILETIHKELKAVPEEIAAPALVATEIDAE